jgi:hypothetical protein
MPSTDTNTHKHSVPHVWCLCACAECVGAAYALSALRACRRLLVEVTIPLDLPPCEVRRVGEEGASEDAGDS